MANAHLTPDKLIFKLMEIKAEITHETERQAIQEAIEYIREKEDDKKLRKGELEI